MVNMLYILLFVVRYCFLLSPLQFGTQQSKCIITLPINRLNWSTFIWQIVLWQSSHVLIFFFFEYNHNLIQFVDRKWENRKNDWTIWCMGWSGGTISTTILHSIGSSIVGRGTNLLCLLFYRRSIVRMFLRCRNLPLCILTTLCLVGEFSCSSLWISNVW